MVNMQKLHCLLAWLRCEVRLLVTMEENSTRGSTAFRPLRYHRHGRVPKAITLPYLFPRLLPFKIVRVGRSAATSARYSASAIAYLERASAHSSTVFKHPSCALG